MGHVPHLHLPAPWHGPAIPLADEQGHHLRRVLRLVEGEDVSYTDGAGIVGSGRFVAGEIERGEEAPVARPGNLNLVVAPPSSRDRLRFLVEKAAELGVARLLWCRTRRTDGRPPQPEKAVAWAAGALEQSRGAWLLELGTTTLDDLDPHDLVVADLTGSDSPPAHRQTLLVGPEGGLDPDEIPPGAATFSLGTTILRVETAALVGSHALIRRPGAGPHH